MKEGGPTPQSIINKVEMAKKMLTTADNLANKYSARAHETLAAVRNKASGN